MKVIKPLKLGTLHRTFEYQGRCFWAPAILAFFSFENGAAAQLGTEIDMWTFCASELGKSAILDQGMPKARGELVVTGAFHAPGGQPVPAGQVRVRLGTVNKTLFVFGDRHWRRDYHLVWGISDPLPVATMPIDYAKAFGGSLYKANPLGKGLPDEPEADRTTPLPLPNVEDPKQLIGSQRDRPAPAGLGPLDSTWPQRAAKCGTYDDQWYQHRFPGLADDIDWTFFNTAPDDQQIEGFFEGIETFTIEGMHPDTPVIEGRLPGLRPRCFITHRQEKAQTFKEVDLHLDTVWLFPHARRGILIYHGLVPIQSDTASEIDHLLLAYEFQKDPPRDLIHYHEALNRRLDKERGALSMLDETDLIGANERSGYAEMLNSETVSDMKGEGLLQKKQRQRMEMDIAAMRAMIAEQGLNPDQTLPLPAPADPETDRFDFDQILTAANDQREAAEARLAAQLQTLGLTKDDMLHRAASEPAPRPAFTAAGAIAAFQAMGIQDPDLEKKMSLMETTLRRTYRQAGHALPPVLLASPGQRDQRRQELLEAYAAGLPPPNPDLAGIDLAGLNLEGIDLRGVLLEDAHLAGTCLRNARMEEIALMRSDLSRADLAGAHLNGAGLGRVCLAGASLIGAHLTGASLVGADLQAAIIREADLNEADLSEVRATQADFSGARLVAAKFLEADLARADFADADLSKGLFYKTNLAGADFSRSRLTEAVLVQVKADGCRFYGAQLANLRAAFECTLTDVDFTNADLRGCNFRGADLSGALFPGTDLCGADLSDARLVGCDFTRAKAQKCLFMDADLTDANMQTANLFESLLHRAILFNTRFTGANLYGADFMKARFRNTDVRMALMDRSTLNRWAPR